MMDMPLDTRGKRPSFFEDPALDALMTALLEVMAQNFTLRERLAAMEAVLEQKGVMTSNEVESVVLPKDIATRLTTEQQAMFEDAFRAIRGAGWQDTSARTSDIDAGGIGS